MGSSLKLAVGLTTLLLAACNVSPTDSDFADPRISSVDITISEFTLQAVDCWFEIPAENTAADCFYMHVPQDYENQSGKWIAFPVIRIYANESESDGAPVLHLGGGGPGSPMGFLPGENLTWIWDRYYELVENTGSALFLIDPRGVGMAAPPLNCPEYAEMIEPVLANNFGFEEENARTLAALNKCRFRLESQGVDLSKYNSLMVARDVEKLRLALGIDQWNLYGVSYATRYAQVIVREYPDTVASMVLDAATFPGIKYTERSGEDLMQAFQRLFEYCKQNNSCVRKMGDTATRFWALAEELDRHPLEFEYFHPFKSEWMTVLITGNRFLNVWFNALYYTESYDTFADVIISMEKGELGQFDTALYDWIYYLVDSDYAEAAAIAHYCHEELAFVDYQTAIDSLQVLPEFIRPVASAELKASFQQCRDWQIPAASIAESQAVETSVPTLFLHGALDPVLPVEDIEEQIKSFPQSDMLIFRELSHSVVGSHYCGGRAAREFFQNKLDFRDTLDCDL